MPDRRAPGALALLVLATALGACGTGRAPRATVAATVAITPRPGGVAVAGDAVWVAASTTFGAAAGPPQHTLVRVDPATARVVATVPVPVPMVAVAVSPGPRDGAVWAVGTRDPTAESGEPAGVVVRVDPATGAVVADVELGVGAPSDLAVAADAVWVADSRGDRVLRIDPATNRVVAQVSVPGPTSVAMGPDGVWVASPDGKVRRIDPATNRVAATVATGRNPTVVVAGAEGVWVSNYADEDVVRIDAARQSVAARVGFDASASRMALDGNRLVVAETEIRRLSEIDTARREPARRTVLTGHRIVSVAVVGRTVWAVDHDRNALLRVELPA